MYVTHAPGMHAPTPCEQNDKLTGVKTKPCRNFVAGGKNRIGWIIDRSAYNSPPAKHHDWTCFYLSQGIPAGLSGTGDVMNDVTSACDVINHLVQSSHRFYRHKQLMFRFVRDPFMNECSLFVRMSNKFQILYNKNIHKLNEKLVFLYNYLNAATPLSFVRHVLETATILLAKETFLFSNY